MTEMFAHVNVKILEKEYEISCPANERADLLDSAEVLNGKMREIRDSGKVVGLDRIAVMAALNLANDLLKARQKGDVLESAAKERVQAMRERVETALQNGQQIELWPTEASAHRPAAFWIVSDSSCGVRCKPGVFRP